MGHSKHVLHLVWTAKKSSDWYTESSIIYTLVIVKSLTSSWSVSELFFFIMLMNSWKSIVPFPSVSISITSSSTFYQKSKYLNILDRRRHIISSGLVNIFRYVQFLHKYIGTIGMMYIGRPHPLLDFVPLTASRQATPLLRSTHSHPSIWISMNSNNGKQEIKSFIPGLI